MCAVFDYKVRRLQRVRIMHIELGDLKPGKWRELSASEIKALGVD
jgi:23S rRNA pseudouridine2604 synthase